MTKEMKERERIEVKELSGGVFSVGIGVRGELIEFESRNVGHVMVGTNKYHFLRGEWCKEENGDDVKDRHIIAALNTANELMTPYIESYKASQGSVKRTD